MNQQLTVARLFTFLMPLVFLIANLGQAGVLYVGGTQIITGALSIGEWQEFALYLMYLFFPIASFGFIITQMGQAGASADRIFEIRRQERHRGQAGCRHPAQGHRPGPFR
jgi:ATP-binding cassette subfamily B protein